MPSGNPSRPIRPPKVKEPEVAPDAELPEAEPLVELPYDEFWPLIAKLAKDAGFSLAREENSVGFTLRTFTEKDPQAGNSTHLVGVFAWTGRRPLTNADQAEAISVLIPVLKTE